MSVSGKTHAYLNGAFTGVTEAGLNLIAGLIDAPGWIEGPVNLVRDTHTVNETKGTSAAILYFTGLLYVIDAIRGTDSLTGELIEKKLLHAAEGLTRFSGLLLLATGAI